MDALSTAVLHGKHMAKCPEAGARAEEFTPHTAGGFLPGQAAVEGRGVFRTVGLEQGRGKSGLGPTFQTSRTYSKCCRTEKKKTFLRTQNVQIPLLLMQNIWEEGLLELCLHWDIKWEGVALQRLFACIEYILQDPKFDEAKVGEMLRKVRKDGAEVMRSAAERIHQRGREEGRVEGRVEGREEGLEKGREEGEKVGMEKGHKEGEKVGMEKGRKEIAVRMLKQGTPAKTVSELTGLSPFELNQLQ